MDEILVEVTRNEEPVENYPVTVAAEWIEGSGGHNHNGSNDLPVPTMEQVGWIVNPEEADSLRGELPTFTNADGLLRLRYRAPQFGGEVKLVARTINSRGDTLQSDDQLTVRVPGLVPLANGTHYRKVGGTSSHHGPRLDNSYPNSRTPDNNHYGTRPFVDSLISLSDSWYNFVTNDSTQDNRQYPLNINDMSLPYGGKFDIEGRFYTRISYHAYHRVGRDVDIRTTRSFPISPSVRNGILLEARLDAKGNPETYPNGNVIYENSEFEELGERKGANPGPTIHGTGGNEHYHLYFY